MSAEKSWIVEWFASNTGASVDALLAGSERSYFEQGWMDSFTFIRFITELEEAQSIRFKNDDFQDRSFSTIDGLAAMVAARRAGRG